MTPLVEIKILNFRESLKLCQRAVFTGLIISGVFYYLSGTASVEKLPQLPILNLEFSTVESLRAFLLVLYMGMGIAAWNFSHKAVEILSTMEDRDVALAVSKYPCIIVTNGLIRLCLSAALIGIGLVLASQIFDGNHFYIFMLSFVVFPPFYMTLENGKKIYQWGAESPQPEEAC